MAPGKYDATADSSSEPFQIPAESGSVLVTASVHHYMVLPSAQRFFQSKQAKRVDKLTKYQAWSDTSYIATNWWKSIAKVFSEAWLQTDPPDFKRPYPPGMTVASFETELDSDEDPLGDPVPSSKFTYLQFHAISVKRLPPPETIWWVDDED